MFLSDTLAAHSINQLLNCHELQKNIKQKPIYAAAHTHTPPPKTAQPDPNPKP